MPSELTYPGVYVEEIPSGVRTIVGVATSITAFVGRATRGPLNEPTTIFGFGDFERQFGGLSASSTMSYAVRDFYLNGGRQAIIVRVDHNPPSTSPPPAGGSTAPPAGSAGTGPPPPAGPAVRAAHATIDLRTVASTGGGTPATGGGGTPATSGETPATGDQTPAAEDGTPTAEGGTPAGPAAGDGILHLEAASPGAWGNRLKVGCDYPDNNNALFNLTILETDPDDAATVVASERFVNLSVDADHPRYLPRVLAAGSTMIRVKKAADGTWQVPDRRPLATPRGQEVAAAAGSGSDGAALVDADLIGDEGDKTGIYALEKVDLFNLLCLPPPVRDGSTGATVYQEALPYCVKRRAFLLVDPEADWTAPTQTAAKAALSSLGLAGKDARNAALYFPRLLVADPLRDNQTISVVPCGAVAGVMARTDADRGVWKAPAGLDAAINGLRGLSVEMSDNDNGQLNPLGVNGLRTFPLYGRVVWGSRTLRGSDQAADEYKYIPVRRLALYLEETLFRNLKWVVFEPNDEPLWAQIRLNVGAFMHDLFRQGAFQGNTPDKAYLVRCDSQTTTQNDVDKGIVNIVVGFAPLKPAEFVVIKLQQLAGQIQT